MNQYFQEQAILYVSKLKRQREADWHQEPEHETRPEARSHGWLHLLTRIMPWLRGLFRQAPTQVQRRRGEGWN